MSNRTAGLAAGVLSVLALASPAAAAPVTVDLRVEGPTRTVYESPVTTDARRFRFTGETADHPCDGRAPAGSATAPQVTRGAVLAAAADAGLDVRGTFSTEFGSPSFASVGGEAVGFDAGTGAFLGEFKNGRASEVGACGDPVAAGDRVLFAYGPFGAPLLSLAAGAATAAPGAAVSFTVTDEAGRPVAGASVGGATTGADGRASVTLTGRGPTEFKATKAGAIRSNRAAVCVTDGQDGQCGVGAAGRPPAPVAAPAPPAARDAAAPAARIAGVREQARFTRARAPRELRFSAVDPSGLASLKLRLTRRSGARCAYLSGSKDRFVASRCGRAFPFALAADATSFLIPERLGRGRYVLDLLATDRAGNRTPLARGTTRIVFTVR